MTFDEMVPRWNLCEGCGHPLYLMLLPNKWRHCLPIIAATKCFVKQCDCVMTTVREVKTLDEVFEEPKVCTTCNIGKICQCMNPIPKFKESLFVIPTYDKSKVIE